MVPCPRPCAVCTEHNVIQKHIIPSPILGPVQCVWDIIPSKAIAEEAFFEKIQSKICLTNLKTLGPLSFIIIKNKMNRRRCQKFIIGQNKTKSAIRHVDTNNKSFVFPVETVSTFQKLICGSIFIVSLLKLPLPYFHFVSSMIEKGKCF